MPQFFSRLYNDDAMLHISPGVIVQDNGKDEAQMTC